MKYLNYRNESVWIDPLQHFHVISLLGDPIIRITTGTPVTILMIK
jgi:hypothetical protein